LAYHRALEVGGSLRLRLEAKENTSNLLLAQEKEGADE